MIKAGLKDAGKRFVQLFVSVQCTAPTDTLATDNVTTE